MRVPGFVATLIAAVWLALGAHAANRTAVDMPGIAPDAVTYGADRDGDGDPDEVQIILEVAEIQEEVYPGGFVNFWVFAPESRGMVSTARLPSPTIRVEQGDHVRIVLRNTHYFPHTIHLHGTIHDNAADGVPVITQPAVIPGEDFVYEFVARNPGTYFYHCHVHPDVHVLMGLAGMLIIEPDRPDNSFAALVSGAGQIPDMAKATAERYDREYSLVYMDVDDRLNRIPAAYPETREVEMRMHRHYESTQRQPNLFLLNGRAFPFTLLDTPIEVASDERVRLRILNAGARTISLHTHGHHPIVTHEDGYPLPESQRRARDTFTIGPAQRLDLELRTGRDDVYASGPGVWLIHDHSEHTTTNRGIGPGGDITAIVYEGHRGPDGLPRTAESLARYFDPAYYRGEVPVFDPGIYHTTPEAYAYGWSEAEPLGGRFSYPTREEGVEPLPERSALEGHQVVAEACAAPRGEKRVTIKGGREYAREGEVFGFEPRVLRLEACQEVELTFENADPVRHALMLPGLNPMFTIEFTGPGKRTARFVTPAEDVTLEFHCHVQTHERVGMAGRIVIGEGGRPDAGHDEAEHRTEEARELYRGIGLVLSIDERTGRFVIDHEEIPGFMAPMVMSYEVEPPSLLSAIEPNQTVEFVIDAGRRAVVEFEIIEE